MRNRKLFIRQPFFLSFFESLSSKSEQARNEAEVIAFEKKFSNDEKMAAKVKGCQSVCIKMKEPNRFSNCNGAIKIRTKSSK
jgi:hypothetical protein